MVSLCIQCTKQEFVQLTCGMLTSFLVPLLAFLFAENPDFNTSD